MENKLAVGYCRVSTEEQAADGVSIEAQDAAIRYWCKVNGFTLVKMYHEVKSGKNVDARPRFQTCVIYGCQLKAAVVTYDLGRAARSLPDALSLATHLHDKGAHFVSIKEGTIDTTTPYGELIFRIMATFNDFQRKQIVEKTTASLDQLRANGKKWCKNAPYGYAFEGSDFVQCPAELRVLNLIRSLYLMKSYKAWRIADILNRRKIKRRNGSIWFKANVQKLLYRIDAGDEKYPTAAKRPRARPLALELTIDFKTGKPPKPRTNYGKHDRPLKKPRKPAKPKRTREEYLAWVRLVKHPCLKFESPELTPAGFRNLTPEEEKYSRRKKWSRNPVIKPILRTPKQVIVEEEFEQMDAVTMALVERLLSEDIPHHAPEEFEEKFEAEEIVEAATAPQGTNPDLPWLN